MGKKIKIEFTEPQFNCLMSVIDSASAVFKEDPITQKEIKLIDRALNKAGYKRTHK